jgi:thiol-disulfide isomerase/thioredoxin
VWTLAGASRAGVPGWYTALEEASVEARNSDKPMLLDFWADWCAACKVMNAEVYTDAFLNDASRRLLLVRIDFDKKQAIARKYNVKSLPTIVFTDSYGGELFRHPGYLGAKAMAQLVQELPADIREVNRLNRVLAEDRNDLSALEAMGRNLRAAGLFRASNQYYGRALQSGGSKAPGGMRATILSAMGLNFLELEEGRAAADSFEKIFKESSPADQRPEWTLGLARAYVLMAKRDRARGLLQGYLRDHPDAAATPQVAALLASLDTESAGRAK